ncbi:pentatricopeptide repeat-containing protein At1g26900, mitochondrial [Gastrolobium bilobum]|uniref:pentatricopeptide repeat-containing protein At1g26900, mitochondrial n=1 Tax=Gastrolobium bilobum TaxID=150636 RepID=UPI002AB30D45|nr:pentatricopeptide repeat-containing protein At1g26900, mitochondrial [Gastrolobium bilobum]
MNFGNASLWLRRSFQLCPTPKTFSLCTQSHALHQNLTLVLKSCKSTSEIHQIHGYMVKTALENVPFTLSKLLAASIVDMDYAASIFSYIQNPNLFMFNTMLRGYSISNSPNQAFPIFNELRNRGIVLDQFSFITVLKACGRVSEVRVGQGIHGIAVRSGNRIFVDVKNTLLHFYCVCRRIEDAHKLFDELPEGNDLVSCNTLMGGYLFVSQPSLVFDLFWKMCLSGLKASVATILCLLSAAGDIGNFVVGKSLHGYCIRIGFSSDLNVLTALIDLYAKTGHIYLARKVFDGLADKDVVLWNCLIGKYARNGLVGEAMALLQQMRLQGVKPNSSTLAGLLSACPASGSTQLVRYITSFIEEEKVELDAVLGTALVDMYAKCGFLDEAMEIFERMEDKDVKSWTAMISGHGVHGQPTNAIRLFNRMENEGFKPNEVTFLAILTACSHGGLIIEGMEIFKRMVQEYGFSLRVEHYGCLIDLLGRAGMLHEAHKLIKSLPIKGDATAWRTLLSACRVYGDVKLGECVKDVLNNIYTEHPTDSLLISSIYAVAGRTADLVRMQEMKQTNFIVENYGVHETEGESMVKEASMKPNVGQTDVKLKASEAVAACERGDSHTIYTMERWTTEQI